MTAAPPLDGWPSSLSGRFVPDALLGRGSFGTVFSAIDRARAARVAVKVLRADRPQALLAFKREFRALADLAHEHLVPLHELGCEGETWFLVMEAVDGEDLVPALRARRDQVRPVFAQLALGLAFLHGAGRLHRDLKPPNVRVTPEGRAVLLDFGLAVEREGEGAHELVGAAAYLAPEQAAGARASAASDLYALGVMLHEVLLGRRPFEGPALEVLAAKRSRDVVIPRDGLEAPLVDLCEALLRRAPDERPTAAEVVRLLDAGLVPLLSVRPEARLLGREQPLAVLSAAAEAPVATAVWLHGPPGIGKSALLRHFLAERTRAGTLVLQSRCFEHETTPFKAVDGLVDGLARWWSGRRGAPAPDAPRRALADLARSFPSLRPLVDTAASSAPPELHRREAAVALRELLAFAASEGPLVVAVDDLHWADADSIPLLAEVLEAPGLPRFLFLGALRDEGHPLLEPLRRQPPPPGALVRVELGLEPLGEAESLALAREVAPGTATLDALARGAGGNPFLLQALAGGEGSLSEAVRGWLARLPAPAERLLEVVCLADAPLTRAIGSVAATLVDQDALALNHLRAGRLVRVRRDGTLEPYHDSLRRAVLECLSPPARREGHGRLADALSAAGADPQRLAHHLAEAGRLAEASEQAVRGAARAAEALAFNLAAELYARALSWSERPDARALRRERGRALANAGRGPEAAEALLAACEGAPPAEALELKVDAGAQLLRAGVLERGVALTREVLEARGLSLAKTPRGAVASLLWTRARLRLSGYDFKPRPASSLPAEELARVDALIATSVGLAAVDSLRAADLMSQALLRALRLGEPRRVAVCLGYEIAFSGNRGGAGEALTMKVAAAARRAAATLADPYVHACVVGGEGIAYFHLGLLSDAVEHCERSASAFERIPGAAKEYFTERLFALVALGHRGHLLEVAARVRQDLPTALARGDHYLEANLRSGLANLAWLGADDPARAREELDLARARIASIGYSVQHLFEWLARVHLELYVGDVRAARVALEAGAHALRRSLLIRTEWVSIYSTWLAGRVALADGRAADALAAAKRLEGHRRPWSEALALGLRACAAPGAQLFSRAAEACARAELDLLATLCRFRAAELTGASTTEVRAALAQLGVQHPERMAAVFVPVARSP